MKQLALAFSLLLFASGAVHAQGGLADGAPGYDACLQLFGQDAAAALDMAQTLKLKRGEDAAGGLHCEALALMQLNRPGDAGRTFFELAERLTRADDMMRAEIYGQAGDAFAIAGDAPNAIRAYDNAIAREPGEAGYHAGRARVKAIAGNWEGARDDAAEALAIDPFSVDALLLRAAANRTLGYPRAALVDANRAVEMRPRDLDALLERGLVHRALGDGRSARADWLAVRQIAEETGRQSHAAAIAAETYLRK